jgi:hypothetical protein
VNAPGDYGAVPTGSFPGETTVKRKFLMRKYHSVIEGPYAAPDADGGDE